VRKLFKRNEVDEDLDAEINACYVRMRRNHDDPEQYSKDIEHLERLKRLRAEGRPKPVSRDTMWLVFANLAGVVIIVAAERTSVMISRGFNHLVQPKVK
jgi:hypothetical protein